ncbi:MAG: VWA domain-containing protein, partial [Imperialibacter sp.]
MTENNNLLFEHSPWWILACCALGLLYAFLLYQKKSTWSTLTNRILFSIRFLLVSFLAILLLSPFLRLVLNQVEEPIFVLALDNSTSVASGLDSTQLLAVSRQVDQLAAALGAKDITVERRNLNNEDLSKFVGTPFDQKTTDLSTLLREWQTEFEGRAFAGALIVSDGIYNKGMAPQYLNFTGKVYTLGVGDTIPVKDLILNNVQFNKIAYQGNLFPVRAEVINQGIEAAELEVSVLKDGKIISTQKIKGGGGELLNADFQVPAEQKGLQHYVVQVSNHPEETILSNNQQDIY